MAAPTAPVTGSRALGQRPLLWAALATGLVFGALAVSVYRGARPGVIGTEPVRFTIASPAGGFVARPVPSPDARHIAFVTDDDSGPALWIRSLEVAMPRRIAGTEHAREPFWSPEGDFVGFFAEGRLKKVSVTGDLVRDIGAAVNPLGATWGRDGVILFNPVNRAPLSRVSAAGGPPAPVTSLDASRNENSHRWPHFLPDGRHFLYTARSHVRALSSARPTPS
jgi:Tol biopolymer transport system component